MNPPLKVGDRVRYHSGFLPSFDGSEGVVISAGEKTAYVRFGYERLNCSQERLERIESGQ